VTEELKVQQVKVSDLYFDHDNPRLAEYGITKATPEDEVLKILWDAMDVRELVQSISASGFFPQEALIIAEEAGRKIVIEGNRRLAAVKVCLQGIGMVSEAGPFLSCLRTQKTHYRPCQLSVRVVSRHGAFLDSSTSMDQPSGAVMPRLLTLPRFIRLSAFHSPISPIKLVIDTIRYNACIVV
jgi:hypothetical protein